MTDVLMISCIRTYSSGQLWLSSTFSGMSIEHSSVPEFIIINTIDYKREIYPGLSPIVGVSSLAGPLLPQEHLLGHPHQQLVHVVFEHTRGLHVLRITALGLLFTI